MLSTLNHAWEAKPSSFSEKDFNTYIEFLKSENNKKVDINIILILDF